jgi:hypothetical protein
MDVDIDLDISIVKIYRNPAQTLKAVGATRVRASTSPGTRSVRADAPSLTEGMAIAHTGYSMGAPAFDSVLAQALVGGQRNAAR